MKTETITIITSRTLAEISTIIRNAATRLKARIVNTDSSPFGNVGIRTGDISLAIYGSNFFMGGPRKWGLQVVVFDNGKEREVELIAVGDYFTSKLAHGSSGQPYFELKDSKRRLDAVSRLLAQ